jgi:hypothetical protein
MTDPAPHAPAQKGIVINSAQPIDRLFLADHCPMSRTRELPGRASRLGPKPTRYGPSTPRHNYGGCQSYNGRSSTGDS